MCKLLNKTIFEACWTIFVQLRWAKTDTFCQLHRVFLKDVNVFLLPRNRVCVCVFDTHREIREKNLKGSLKNAFNLDVVA